MKTNKKCKFLKDDRPPIVSDTAIRSFVIGQKKIKISLNMPEVGQYNALFNIHTVILMGERRVFKDIAVSLGFFYKMG